MNKKSKSKKIIIIASVMLIMVIGLKQKYIESDVEVIKNNVNEQKKYVYPFGKLVGIKASTDGVLVIGYEKEDIEYIGGLQKGDNIVKINNKKIENSKDVSDILQNLKEDEVEVTFERDNKYNKEIIKINKDNSKPRLGLWVRDKISGVGTITFYDPINFKFGAIGHSITDSETNEFLKIKKGHIYNPISIEITKANDNKVGSIKGEFSTSSFIGEFNNNSNYGINGSMKGEINNNVELVEVGKRKDVNLGKAYILFEDKNRNIESYDILIKNFVHRYKNNENMLIEIIDEDLINYTGGIIQGMSGAPIIQNNKIIGAVTHVFKDDSKKGYGIFIDEMIELDKRY